MPRALFFVLAGVGTVRLNKRCGVACAEEIRHDDIGGAELVELLRLLKIVRHDNNNGRRIVRPYGADNECVRFDGRYGGDDKLHAREVEFRQKLRIFRIAIAVGNALRRKALDRVWIEVDHQKAPPELLCSVHEVTADAIIAENKDIVLFRMVVLTGLRLAELDELEEPLNVRVDTLRVEDEVGGGGDGDKSDEGYRDTIASERYPSEW